MYIFYIIAFILLLIIFKFILTNKIKIKWKTFLSKGFKAKRGNFGLYTYTGNQGKGKTLSLTEYIFDNKDSCVFFLNIRNIKCLNLIDFNEYLKKDCDFRYRFCTPLGVQEINEKLLGVDSSKIGLGESISSSNNLDSISPDSTFVNQTQNLARRNLASNLADETTLPVSEGARQLASGRDNTTVPTGIGIGTASSVSTGPSWFATFEKKGVGNSHEDNRYSYDLNDLFIDKNYNSSKGLGLYFNGFDGLVKVKKALDSGLFDDLIKDKQVVFVFDELFTELTRNTTLSTEIQDFLCQLRKRKIIFLTTAQVWSELPLYLRRLCRYQINCDIINLPTFSILVKEFRDAENMKWDGDLQEHVAPIVETSVTKCRLCVANQYDTLERITNEVVKKNERKESLL